MKRIIRYVSLITVLFIIGIYTNALSINDVTLGSIKQYFLSEKEFHSHIKNNVSFNSLSFAFHNIKRGDNFWKIAKKYNVNIDTLIGANPHWSNLRAHLKQTIIVPSQKGVLHFIYHFDEIDKLAQLYKTKKSNILIQELPFLYKYYYTLKQKKEPIAVFIKNVKPKADFLSDKLARQFKMRELFRSPLGGRLSSFFGNRRHPIFKKWGFHDGIDIAARHRTLVGASREGRVTASGWMGGYGLAIIIVHPGGFKTLYGHLSSIFVRKGAYVKTGQLIGRVGSTGLSTGPHLHFTLWHNGRLLNPLKVLW